MNNTMQKDLNGELSDHSKQVADFKLPNGVTIRAVTHNMLEQCAGFNNAWMTEETPDEYRARLKELAKGYKEEIQKGASVIALQEAPKLQQDLDIFIAQMNLPTTWQYHYQINDKDQGMLMFYDTAVVGNQISKPKPILNNRGSSYQFKVGKEILEISNIHAAYGKTTPENMQDLMKPEPGKIKIRMGDHNGDKSKFRDLITHPTEESTSIAHNMIKGEFNTKPKQYDGFACSDQLVEIKIYQPKTFAVQKGQKSYISGLAEEIPPLQQTTVIIGELLRKNAKPPFGASPHITMNPDGSISADFNNLKGQSEPIGYNPIKTSHYVAESMGWWGNKSAKVDVRRGVITIPPSIVEKLLENGKIKQDFIPINKQTSSPSKIQNHAKRGGGVKIYSAKGDERRVALKFDSEAARNNFIQAFASKANECGVNIDNLFQKIENNKDVLYIAPSKGKGTLGTYVSINEELAVQFGSDQLSATFAGMLGLPPQHAHGFEDSGALYFNNQILPKKPDPLMQRNIESTSKVLQLLSSKPTEKSTGRSR